MMICASVPLSEVRTHLDATLGADDDHAPLSSRLAAWLFAIEPAPQSSREEAADPVFLLTSLRHAA